MGQLKDQIIHDAVIRHACDVERGLERLVAQGADLDELALNRTIKWPDAQTMRLTTKIVPRSKGPGVIVKAVP